LASFEENVEREEAAICERKMMIVLCFCLSAAFVAALYCMLLLLLLLHSKVEEANDQID